MQARVRIDLPMDKIEDFCRRWHITELVLFGSVLRDDFRPDSDVDVLITVEPGVHWPWGGYGEMTEELEEIFGRKVDLGEKRWVEESENPFRRKSILSNMKTIYAS
ncbi:MAG: nucleotidyltransferase domain-containing protein [Chloroflexi bacterium]|nr:nucleotidyltransferase domain-containing protein [Chloroflexota bacterium]